MIYMTFVTIMPEAIVKNQKMVSRNEIGKTGRILAKGGFELADTTKLQIKKLTKEIDPPLGADSSID